MADNIEVTPGTGKTVAADEIAGALHQRVKITIGADGTNDGDVSSTNPLPISDAGGSITVDGTVAVTNAGITSIDGKITACNTGSIAGTVTANAGTNLNTSALALEAGGNLAAAATSLAAIDDLAASTFVTKTVDFTESQTAQTLWEPTGGKKFVICDMIVGISGAGSLTLFDGTDNAAGRVGKFFFPANVVINKGYTKPRISDTANNILKYTSSAGAAGSITVSGYEV